MKALFKLAALLPAVLLFCSPLTAQEPDSVLAPAPDSTREVTTFSGTVGLTTNGFSIIPTFSLNSPAVIMNYYVSKNRFSFDPDIRLTPTISKGGLIFWFRYRVVDKGRFSLRLGVHPAFSLIRKTVTDNGEEREITEALRFLAGEIVPTYKITPNWSVGAVYLHGSGLQAHGPQNTDVLFLNTSISNIRLVKDFRLAVVPMVFFLSTDGYTGSYFSGTAAISHTRLPFAIQSTINQTFRSDIPGNQIFMWNVTLNYSFSREFVRVR